MKPCSHDSLLVRIPLTQPDAAHGTTTAVPWLPATLEAVHAALHDEAFWCRRKGDAFIRAFGGPYVLGQDEGKLKLIRGAPHTELTAMLSCGHSLVYAATHLALPEAPGFNTLIFGLNLRSSGFYYHQDAEVPGLRAKNAPLVPYQPVVRAAPPPPAPNPTPTNPAHQPRARARTKIPFRSCCAHGPF